MNRLSISAASAFVCVLLTGCSSITGSTNQSMSVQTREQSGSEVSGAACELSNNKGKWFVTTPGSVMIHKSNDDMQVVCEKSGRQPGRAAVVSETKGSMFGNIIFGGGIGAIVDHNNGSAYEYPNFIQVLMGAVTKIEKPKNTEGAAGGSTPATAAPGASTLVSAPASQNTAVSTSNEDRLKELKRLNDQGLISKEVYLERQRVVLEGRWSSLITGGSMVVSTWIFSGAAVWMPSSEHVVHSFQSWWISAATPRERYLSDRTSDNYGSNPDFQINDDEVVTG